MDDASNPLPEGLVILVPYPGTLLPFSIQLCLIVCPLVGVDKNCHDFACCPAPGPVLMYRSTITSPVMVFNGFTTPTLAVAESVDNRSMLSPVINLLLSVPKERVPEIFSVSAETAETDSPVLLVLLTVKFLMMFDRNSEPEMYWAADPPISIVPCTEFKIPELVISPWICRVPPF